MIGNINLEELFDFSEATASELIQSFDYPWQSLSAIAEFVLNLGKKLPCDRYKNTFPGVWIAKDAEVSPSASIIGPTIIDSGVKIRHCAYIRGSVLIGKNSIVGNSTEIKNSILFNEVQVPHYNYIGDSILGYRVHFGAGSITSNVKSDKSVISITTEKGKFATGLKKFGAICGDFTEIGCNAVLNPGTILGKNCSVYPLTMVRGYIPGNTIVKNNGSIVKKH